MIDLELKIGYLTTYERATVVSYAYEANLLEHTNLEGQYGKIESDATPVIVKLRNGASLTKGEQLAVVAFLDMHLERGNYSDQTKIITPAVALVADGTTKQADLGLADRLILSRYMEDADRLTDRGLEDWHWEVQEVENVATGDGAVLRFAESKQNGEFCTVIFPLSPTQVLFIGHVPEVQIPLNALIASKSRRWLVGSTGSLNINPAPFEATKIGPS